MDEDLVTRVDVLCPKIEIVQNSLSNRKHLSIVSPHRLSFNAFLNQNSKLDQYIKDNHQKPFLKPPKL